jgi:hypothetical protein
MQSVILRLGDFWIILYCLNRRAELIRLVDLAKRKRLSGPLRCYQNRLEDEEIRLNFYTLRHPQLTKWTRWFHRFNDLILPPPRYLRQGSAAIYRRNNLTHTDKKTYSYNYNLT